MMRLVSANIGPFGVRAWTVVRLALGIVLLLAAGLKLAGQNVSAVPQVGWYATPTVQLAAAEWELVLGIWLLSGRYRVGSWLAVVATFSIFAGISGYLAWVGVATCGCFGTIPTSPWWIFAVDLGAMILLGLVRPSLESRRDLIWSECRHLAVAGSWFALGFSGLLAATAAAGALTYGSLEAAMAQLRGDAISVYPSYLDFGTVESGQTLEKTVRVQNWTDRPVRLIGATSNGPCILTDSMPVVIGQQGACEITVRLRIASQSHGRFLTSGEIWTDAEGARVSPILIGCLVKSSTTVSRTSNP